MKIKHLELATDIIQRAAAEAVVQDADGVITRVGAGARRAAGGWHPGWSRCVLAVG